MASILLVDDSRLARRKLKDVLTASGHSIIKECERGDEAIDTYMKFRPDIVTMDLNMPGMSGLDAISTIMEADCNARIIIISSDSQEKIILDGIRRGAKTFLVKPFNDEHVLRAIEKILTPAIRKPPTPEPLQESIPDEDMKGLILLIDDSKVVLKSTTDMLRKAGHTVISSNTGKEGLDLARNGNPDMIILDIVMPDMDGYDVLKELRKDEFIKYIPVMMYSSQTKKQDILLAMKFGITDYLSKTSDESIILSKVKSALLHARNRREELEKNSVNNIIINKKGKNIYITFRFTLKSEIAMNERKKIFTGAFLKTISEMDVIFDFRLINDMDAQEISQLKYIFTLFPEKEIYIVCGKHYAVFASIFDIEGKNRFFISMGDLELNLSSRNGSTPDASREEIG